MGQAFLMGQSGGKGDDGTVVVAIAFNSQSSGSVTTTYKSFTTQIHQNYNYQHSWTIGVPTSLEVVELFSAGPLYNSLDHNNIAVGNGWIYRNSSQTTLGNGIGQGYYAKGTVPSQHIEPMLRGTCEEIVMGQTEIFGYDNGFGFKVIIDSIMYDYNSGTPIVNVNYREARANDYSSSTSRGHNGRFVIMAKVKATY